MLFYEEGSKLEVLVGSFAWTEIQAKSSTLESEDGWGSGADLSLPQLWTGHAHRSSSTQT